MDDSCKCNISRGPVFVFQKILQCDDKANVTCDSEITIEGSTEANDIVIRESSGLVISLVDVFINSTNGVIVEGSNFNDSVTIQSSGTNIIHAKGNFSSGIACSKVSINFRGHSHNEDELTIYGGHFGAGIGKVVMLFVVTAAARASVAAQTAFCTTFYLTTAFTQLSQLQEQELEQV
jgi:hypothetical protein